MNELSVKHVAGEEWLVTVNANVKSAHRVKVTNADLSHLAPGRSAEELLAASFEFLLEREPNTSILSSFDIPVIGRYFPEYEQEIKRRLAERT